MGISKFEGKWCINTNKGTYAHVTMISNRELTTKQWRDKGKLDLQYKLLF